MKGVVQSPPFNDLGRARSIEHEEIVVTIAKRNAFMDQDDSQNETGSKKKFENYCFWATGKLKKEKRVTPTDFFENFKTDLPELKSTRDSEWSRVSYAVFGTLRALGCAVTLENKTLGLMGEINQPKRFENDEFRPYDQFEEKEKIGKLVAFYLSQRQDRHCLLGSGSTVYHVALQMRKINKPFKQLFWTINFALLADWSEFGSPIDDVEVPQGKLRPKTFRYESMDPPPWNPPIVVIGADGCYYEEQEEGKKETGAAHLFANRGSVAFNTNLFIRKASDTVICCLTSSKLDYELRLKKDGGLQNDGPLIIPPTKKVVQRLLVTDTMPRDKRIIEALEKDGWLPVTREEQFPGLPKK